MSISPAHDVALEMATMIARAARLATGPTAHNDVRVAFTNFAQTLEQLVAGTRELLEKSEAEHTYPEGYAPGVHWAIDAAWECMDMIKPGVLSLSARDLVAGMIAGKLLEAAKRKSP